MIDHILKLIRRQVAQLEEHLAEQLLPPLLSPLELRGQRLEELRGGDIPPLEGDLAEEGAVLVVLQWSSGSRREGRGEGVAPLLEPARAEGGEGSKRAR